jgi:hypothetical protein
MENDLRGVFDAFLLNCFTSISNSKGMSCPKILLCIAEKVVRCVLGGYGEVEKILSEISDEVIEIDISLNHLTSKSLEIIIPWLKLHTDVRICVQNNLFSFDAFYRKLLNMDAIYLISESRLNMSATDVERRIEMLALESKKNDAVMNLIEVQKLFSNNILTEAKENIIKHELAMKRGENTDLRLQKLTEGVNRSIGWVSNQCRLYENTISCALQLYLEKNGFTIIKSITEKDERIIPSMGSSFTIGVEWDGVLYCEKEDEVILFLIEAKSFLPLDGDCITTMPKRIERTIEFIRLCQEGELPPTELKEKRKAHVTFQCDSWRRFYGCSVKGVVGTPVMKSTESFKIIKEECYILVSLKDDMYVVADGEKSEKSELCLDLFPM